MKITIQTPLYINEKGKRQNNEDCIYPFPQTATESSTLFLVCDGVGGLAKGEVASNLACTSFAAFFSENNIETSNHNTIMEAFNFVQQQFDDQIEKEPAIKGFGTTLTLLHLHQNGATVAHCGDSRVYHFRNREIIFKTTDHNAVNDLLKAGIITPEEAAQQPRTNKITRAMQGNKVMQTKPDIHTITNLQENDYFLLCSDGVHGCMEDTDFIDIIFSNQTPNEKIDTVKTLCEANSNDNFSLYLIKISDIYKEKNFSIFNFFSNIVKKRW